ncbi:MAG: hypothetical protein WC901_03885 [Candidatus Margulisiibacteriota bacterium]
MKKLNLWVIILLMLAFWVSTAAAQMTFFLVDNFEDGDHQISPEWWKFDNVTLTIVKNSEPSQADFVAQSCGKYSLNVRGKATNWYVGGFGSNLSLDASEYTRIQLDLYGNRVLHGKLRVEIYEDDNNNNQLEQDSAKGWIPTKDDKWSAEVNILGEGFTRVSIPFSAFVDENPGVGDDKWNPDKKGDSGGLLKVQFIAIADKADGEVNFNLDNILLTY